MDKFVSSLNYKDFSKNYKREIKWGLFLGVFYIIYSLIGNTIKLDNSYKSLLSNTLLLVVVLTFLVSGIKAYKTRQRDSVISAIVVGFFAWIVSIFSLFLFTIIFRQPFNLQNIFESIVLSLVVTSVLASLLGGFAGFLATRFRKKKK